MFLCGFVFWGSFGCDFARDDSLVNMAACWTSVVSAVDACWITSLFTGCWSFVGGVCFSGSRSRKGFFCYQVLSVRGLGAWVLTGQTLREKSAEGSGGMFLI